jgi:hypothetical protein
MNMDLMTVFETNFTIFIGIFVTLAVMGTTTLYDKYKSKGGASSGPDEFKLFSNLNPKIKTFRSEGFKHFSKYSKKLSSLIQKSSGSTRKKSSSVRRASGKNSLDKVGTIFTKVKDTLLKLFASLGNKISSLSSSLPRRNKKDEGKRVSLSDYEDTDTKLSAAEKVNHLDKVVESKRDELDFDDDLLTKMSTSGTLVNNSLQADMAGPFFGEMSSELGESFDNDLMFDENEFAIKVDGLDDEPAGDDFSFNDNSADIKFGEDSDDLLASLKKDIVVTTEKKVNFMNSLQGEDLELALIKSDLEDVLRDLKRFRQYTSHN